MDRLIKVIEKIIVVMLVALKFQLTQFSGFKINLLFMFHTDN